jgi:hypothetical protein
VGVKGVKEANCENMQTGWSQEPLPSDLRGWNFAIRTRPSKVHLETLDFDAAGTKLIEVVDGIVVKVNGSSANTDIMPTIDDLFSRIQEAIDLSAFSISVFYDEMSGYPVDIYIDYDDRIIDEEWIATAVFLP